MAAHSRSLAAVVVAETGSLVAVVVAETAHSRSPAAGLFAAIVAQYILVGYACKAAVVVAAACSCRIPWVAAVLLSHSCEY